MIVSLGWPSGLGKVFVIEITKTLEVSVFNQTLVVLTSHITKKGVGHESCFGVS